MKDTIFLYITKSPKVPPRQKYKTYHKIGQKLLSLGLSKLTGLPELELNELIKTNKYGKPYLKNIPYYFNISHSDEFVICVIASKEIGVDTEKLGSFGDSLYERVLTQNELKYLKKFEREEQDKVFLRFWTLKESYIKQLGRGLSFSLNDVSFKLENSLECSDKSKFFKQFELSETSIISICYPEEFNLEIEYFE